MKIVKLLLVVGMLVAGAITGCQHKEPASQKWLRETDREWESNAHREIESLDATPEDKRRMHHDLHEFIESGQ